MNQVRRSIKTTACLLFFSVCLGMSFPGSAIGQDNPFELTPRMEKGPPPETTTADSQGTGNPFDLNRELPTAEPNRIAPAPARPDTTRRDDSAGYRRLKLFVIFGILLLLAVFLTLLRSLFRKSFQAFANDTVMNQLYREQQGRGIFPFLILYFMFFINAGVFIFFIIKYYQLPQSTGNWPLLLYCIAGIAGLLLLKHLLLAFLGFTFPVEKEVSRYHFVIIIFSIVVGIFLVPVNTLLAYTSGDVKFGVLYGSLAIIALIYLFRYLRSLLIANKFLQFHKFHFLLYICTVEIAPVLFLFKFITNQL